MIDACEAPWDWSTTSMVKARKEHRCAECCRTIEVGEHYNRCAAKYDGSVSSWKTCAHCAAAVTWLQETCRGYLVEGALEDLEQHWDYEIELRSGYLGRAIVGMRRKWRRRDGQLMPVPPKWKPREIAA